MWQHNRAVNEQAFVSVSNNTEEMVWYAIFDANLLHFVSWNFHEFCTREGKCLTICYKIGTATKKHRVDTYMSHLHHHCTILDIKHVMSLTKIIQVSGTSRHNTDDNGTCSCHLSMCSYISRSAVKALFYILRRWSNLMTYHTHPSLFVFFVGKESRNVIEYKIFPLSFPLAEIRQGGCKFHSNIQRVFTFTLLAFRK